MPYKSAAFKVYLRIDDNDCQIFKGFFFISETYINHIVLCYGIIFFVKLIDNDWCLAISNTCKLPKKIYFSDFGLERSDFLLVKIDQESSVFGVGLYPLSRPFYLEIANQQNVLK